MKPSMTLAVSAAALVLGFSLNRAHQAFAQEPATTRPLEQWLGGLLAHNAMEVIDEIRARDGGWREFGRFRLQRAPAA